MSFRKVTLMLAVVGLALVAASASAQTGTLFITGDMAGLYTNTPSYGLHIVNSNADKSRIQVENNGATANRTMLKVANNGFPRVVMEDTATGGQWLMTGGGTFIFGKVGTGVNELVVFGGGNVTIGGTLTQNSSRDVKHNFEAVDSREILSKVVELPLQAWSYKRSEAGERHFGPFAEDFHEAFGLGASPKGISSLDTSGVTMAAVQGLYELVQEKQDRIEELEARLVALEKAIQ